MGDLVTHLCTALLPKGVFGGRYVGSFSLGTVLPDLMARVPGITLQRIAMAGVSIPDWAFSLFDIFHMPVGMVPMFALVAFLFKEGQRKPVFAWLLAGGALHLSLDALQDHFGQGYMLLFPLSLERFELGWMGSEATVVGAIPLALLTGLVWIGRWLRTRRRVTKVGDGSPPS